MFFVHWLRNMYPLWMQPKYINAWKESALTLFVQWRKNIGHGRDVWKPAPVRNIWNISVKVTKLTKDTWNNMRRYSHGKQRTSPTKSPPNILNQYKEARPRTAQPQQQILWHSFHRGKDQEEVDDTKDKDNEILWARPVAPQSTSRSVPRHHQTIAADLYFN